MSIEKYINLLEENCRCFHFRRKGAHATSKIIFEDMGMENRSDDFKKIWNDLIKNGYLNLFDSELLAEINKIESDVYGRFKEIAPPYAIQDLAKGEEIITRFLPKEKEEDFFIYFYDSRIKIEVLLKRIHSEYDEIIKKVLEKYEIIAEENLKAQGAYVSQENIEKYMSRIKSKLPRLEKFDNVGIFLEEHFVTLPKEISIKSLNIQHMRKMNEIIEEEEKIKYQKLHEMEIENAKLVNSARQKVVENTIGDFHNFILSKINDVLKSMDEEGKITNANSKSINTMINKIYDTMTFAGDSDGKFLEKVEDLKKEFNIDSKNRDLESIQKELKEVATKSIEKLKDIDVTIDESIYQYIF